MGEIKRSGAGLRPAPLVSNAQFDKSVIHADLATLNW